MTDHEPAPAPPLPDHVAENRRFWDEYAPQWIAGGERLWAEEPTWGQWGVAEDELSMLPGDMTGLDAIELGCGTGYGSAWMRRRGARVVGLDVSVEQLATARRLAGEHGLDDIAWVEASAEAVPYPEASFDFALSEYGAALWCDPYRWIPEAHRLLRPGGRLVLLTSHPLALITQPVDGSAPVGTELHRPYLGLHRLDWRDAVVDPGGVEFGLPVGGWFALFRRTGFEVDDLIEVAAPADATGTPYTTSAEWSRDFPSELVWKLRRP